MKKIRAGVIIKTVLIGVLFMLSIGCKKEDDKQHVLTVTTGSVITITSTSAYCNGNVVSAEDGLYGTRGVCWSDIATTPTINDKNKFESFAIGGFTIQMSDLSPGTTYYVRAFAYTNHGTAYGNVVSFSTP
jgi:hypothetical protein